MDTLVESLEWHHLLFLFAVIFIFAFRPAITQLIGRVTSIDKSGVKATAAPEAQREAENKEAAQELLRAIGDSIVLNEVEARIKASLDEKGLETEGDTINVLIKHLAAYQILSEFEQTYNYIFGSQIWLLKKLNEVVGQGIGAESVQAHFDGLQQHYAEFTAWSSEQYLAFLIGKSLVLERDGNFHITNLGVEFLTWMARNGRSENNPL